MNMKFAQVTLVGARSRDAEVHLHAAGIRVTGVAASELAAIAHPSATPPQVVIVDLRDTSVLPPHVAALRRQHPETAVILLVSALEPSFMLEAMRAGVTEVVPEPLTQAALDGAVGRVWQDREVKKDTGCVIAVVGAKGGVGATTIAVNVATVLEKESPGQVLLIDLHVAQGDASLLMGLEPRFSVVDALENTQRLDEAYFRGLVVSASKGPSLLASSGRQVIGSPGADRVRALIEFAAGIYPFVVLDVPRTDLNVLDSLDASARIVVVVNQELSAIRNASRLVETLGLRYGKDRLNVALARFDKGAEIETRDVEKVVGLPVTYVVPNDYRAAVRAANQGNPLVKDGQHKVSAALKAMTVDLAGLRQPEPETATSVGLLGRLSLRRSTALF
jgi:pilus assembly protein CpaE